MEDRISSSSIGHKMSAAKRSSMACTTCRQVKLRCDATKRLPAPCSRCEKHRKICLFDAGFKRMPVRGALEKVVEEKEELRRLVHSFRDDPSAVIIPGAGLDPCSPAIPRRKASDHHEPTPAEKPCHYRVESPCSTTAAYDLYGVYLDSQTIHELFEHFCRHYFRHLPVLDIQKPIDSVWNDSTLLFWTVLVTSAREHPVHCVQFPRLYLPFRRLLSEHLFNSIRCIYTIQALLLLCVWPFPVKNQRDDPSWNYCGLAVAAALQMDLHESQGNWRPDASENSAEDMILRLKTWLGCFVVSTSLGADLGLPPPMHLIANMETRIRQRVQNYLPEDFLSQSEIQRYSTRAVTVLNNHASYPLQSSLIDLLERDLHVVGDKLLNPISLTVQIDFLAAKLRLYSLPLLSKQPSEMDNYPDTLSRAVWYKGFHIAVQLADMFTKSTQRECSTPINGPEGQQTQLSDKITIFYPKHYFRVLVMAGMYLLNFLAIYHEISAEDKTLARNRIKQVYETLMHWSRSERDEYARSAKIIELLSRHAEDQNSSPHFSEAYTKPSPCIIDNGMKIVRKIRLKHIASTNKEPTQPQMSDLQPTSMTGLPGLQDGSVPFWDDDLTSEWNAWLSDADDIMELLHSPSGRLPLSLM
ncbi:hypothetical protein V1506DRAFT_572216 [Lipomyces tetrasporus]